MPDVACYRTVYLKVRYLASFNRPEQGKYLALLFYITERATRRGPEFLAEFEREVN